MRPRLLTYSEADFDIAIKNMKINKATFAVEKRGYHRNIYQGKEKTCTSQQKFAYHKELSDPRCAVLLASVRKQVNRYLKEHDFQIEEIKLLYPSVSRNIDRYTSLPLGMTFYYIDVKHCYWRIAYLLGIINEKTYKYYADYKKYKLARNIALSSLATSKEREYFVNGEYVFTLTSDTGPYRSLYTNIRYKAYNTMGSIYEMVREHSLGYQVDGIWVLPYGAEEVKRQLKIKKFYYRSITCQKIDNKSYLYGNEKKEFI
jgi:hypothetical protein